jgi:hypothetical protein
MDRRGVGGIYLLSVKAIELLLRDIPNIAKEKSTSTHRETALKEYLKRFGTFILGVIKFVRNG